MVCEIRWKVREERGRKADVETVMAQKKNAWMEVDVNIEVEKKCERYDVRHKRIL